MSTALGYFLTWTTYGSWLPGDKRGWIKRDGDTIEKPSKQLERSARESMTITEVTLTSDQRVIVEQASVIIVSTVRGSCTPSTSERTTCT